MSATRGHGAMPVERLPPGHATGTRPSGVRGWVVVMRRRLRARLLGRDHPDRLIARGLRVGSEVFIADDAQLDPGFPWLISIGDQTTIGPGVRVLAHDATPKLRTGYSAVAPVRIGARVFVGADAIILPGVNIGDDAIVGAGSVVRRDIAPGTIVMGNPAQEVGSTESHIARHRAEMQRRPRYPFAGTPSAGERERILAELGDGVGYVA